MSEVHTNIQCPLCTGTMRLAKEGTCEGIWICNICPAILFEYWNDDNIKSLKETIV